jgi:hypothetical protein
LLVGGIDRIAAVWANDNRTTIEPFILLYETSQQRQLSLYLEKPCG